MTPDFWKVNLFLTDNNGGGNGNDDILKANVAELKSLLTTGADDGNGGSSSRIKMYASPRLIGYMKAADKEADATANTEKTKMKKASGG
jgi:hypothetical protein